MDEKTLYHRAGYSSDAWDRLVQALSFVPSSALATTGDPVAVSGAAPPTAGQILTATSPTTAEWADPSAQSIANSGGAITIDQTNAPVEGQSLIVNSAGEAQWQTINRGPYEAPPETPSIYDDEFETPEVDLATRGWGVTQYSTTNAATRNTDVEFFSAPSGMSATQYNSTHGLGCLALATGGALFMKKDLGSSPGAFTVGAQLSLSRGTNNMEIMLMVSSDVPGVTNSYRIGWVGSGLTGNAAVPMSIVDITAGTPTTVGSTNVGYAPAYFLISWDGGSNVTSRSLINGSTFVQQSTQVKAAFSTTPPRYVGIYILGAGSGGNSWLVTNFFRYVPGYNKTLGFDW